MFALGANTMRARENAENVTGVLAPTKGPAARGGGGGSENRDPRSQVFGGFEAFSFFSPPQASSNAAEPTAQPAAAHCFR